MTWWGYALAAVISAAAVLGSQWLSGRRDDRRTEVERETKRLDRLYSDRLKAFTEARRLTEQISGVSQRATWKYNLTYARLKEATESIKAMSNDLERALAMVDLISTLPASRAAVNRCNGAAREVWIHTLRLEFCEEEGEYEKFIPRQVEAHNMFAEAAKQLLAQARLELGVDNPERAPVSMPRLRRVVYRLPLHRVRRKTPARAEPPASEA